MELRRLSDANGVGHEAAALVERTVADNPTAVLALPSGRTPIPMYDALVTGAVGGAGFAASTLFLLDEYVGLHRDDPRSFTHFLQRHFISHLATPPRRCLSPDGMAADPDLEARRYEEAIQQTGGLDLVVLGIGRDGHIAFNEPGSSFDSRSRVVELTEQTRADNASEFGGVDQVPKRAITMGLLTLMQARRVIVLATGTSKAAIVDRLLHGPQGPQLPATVLRNHPNAICLVDEAAAAKQRHSGSLRG